MKNYLHKKDSGMLDQILPVFVGVMMLTIVFVLMLNIMDGIQTKNKVDLVARRAILLLETYGYLDASMEADLKSQLAEENVRNIVITTRGYTKDRREWCLVSENNPASYGQKVEVVIKGTIDFMAGTVGGDSIFDTVFAKKEMPFQVTRVSTSKN